MQFHTTLIPIRDSSFRVFIRTNPLEAYALVADLAKVLNFKTDSVRADISRHELGLLVSVPELRQQLKNDAIIPKDSGKVNFAVSNTWLGLLMRHFSEDVITGVENALQEAYSKAREHDKLVDEIEEIEEIPPTQVFSSGQVLVPSSQPEGNDDIQNSPCGDAYEQHDDAIVESDYEEDSGSASDPSDEEEVEAEVEDEEEEDSDSEGSSSDSSSDSSDSEGDDDDADELPDGVADWVITDPEIPEQFSSKDFSKSYSLKDYDIKRPLKKELKKLRKWWTKSQNRERKGKSVSDSTAIKRQERILCFLGFVSRYDCIPEDHQMTLGLFLNHKLFKSFLQYMQQVRDCKPGTIGESLTAAITVCKWLFRKEKSSRDPSIIRRYKDWRNDYQASAVRDRMQNDKDELQEKGKWLDWTKFSNAVQGLRKSWKDGDQSLNAKNTQKLHDLLLLGLYSCIPSRGSEVRLLQYIPEAKVLQLKGDKTFKEWVKQQEINLLTQKNGVWTMIVSQFKNVKSKGVDSTDLSKFQWWTELLQQYLKDGFWDLRMHDKDTQFLFLTKAGDSFETGYFSDYLARRIEKLTGVHVATNAIRSSFITHFYNSDASRDPLLCESIARVMRHSTTEARLTYDRRNGSERKSKGLDFLLEDQQKNAFGKRDRDETPVVEKSNNNHTHARNNNSNNARDKKRSKHHARQ